MSRAAMRKAGVNKRYRMLLMYASDLSFWDETENWVYNKETGHLDHTAGDSGPTTYSPLLDIDLPPALTLVTVVYELANVTAGVTALRAFSTDSHGAPFPSTNGTHRRTVAILATNRIKKVGLDCDAAFAGSLVSMHVYQDG